MTSADDPPQDTASADDRLGRALAAIDAANADDPATLLVDGVPRPKEQAHAELMTAWVQRLAPEASEAQLLAARAHHLRRWELPRASYPEGRAGYLRWRTELARRHAAGVAQILGDCGYGEDVIVKVGDIIRKRRLGSDSDVQVHEDALCLVFLQTQLHDLADRLGDAKTTEVLAKTLAKMSDEGRALAQSLDIGERARGLLAAALQGQPG